MSRLVFLVALAFVLGVFAGAPFLCGETCVASCADDGPDAGCLACPVCSGSGLGEAAVTASGALRLAPARGLLAHDMETPPSPACTEILHIPKPALG